MNLGVHSDLYLDLPLNLHYNDPLTRRLLRERIIYLAQTHVLCGEYAQLYWEDKINYTFEEMLENQNLRTLKVMEKTMEVTNEVPAPYGVWPDGPDEEGDSDEDEEDRQVPVQAAAGG